jgi:hypothetical protein
MLMRGPKLITRRHWRQRSHDQRHGPGGRRAKHQKSENCIRMNHDKLKIKQVLVGPRLVDQPEPYGLGTRKFRNPPTKCAEKGRRFPLKNLGRVSLTQICLRTRHLIDQSF